MRKRRSKSEKERERGQRRERGREPKREAYKLVCHHALHSSTLLCVKHTSHVGGLPNTIAMATLFPIWISEL